MDDAERDAESLRQGLRGQKTALAEVLIAAFDLVRKAYADDLLSSKLLAAPIAVLQGIEFVSGLLVSIGI